MKREFILPPPAEVDLNTHIIYLAENADLEIARRFNNAAKKSFDRLCEAPFIGVQRDFPVARLNGLRMWFVKDFEAYLIFYRVTDTAIEVVRVLHSSRDVENIIAGDPVN